MSREQNKRRIKNLLVNQGVQHRVIAVNLLFMILVIFITMSIIYSHLLEREYGSEGIWNFVFGEFTITLSLKLIFLYLLLVLTFFFLHYSPAKDDSQGVRAACEFLQHL